MDEDENNCSLQIKEELDDYDEREMMDIVMNNSSNLETDPMDLLELAEQRDYFDEISASEHFGTECGDESSNGAESNEDRWQQWSEECPWLLHERHYGPTVYCLYCNMTLSAKAFYYIKQHDTSTNHKEREHSYKEFKRSLGQTAHSDSSLTEIKEELGTTSSVAAMRHKRMLEEEMFNNFNWQCWLQEHEWLVRDQLSGYNGYCKYCKIRMNVEFSYQRKRHEEHAKHKKAERLMKRKDDSRASTGADETQDNTISAGNQHKGSTADEQEKESTDTENRADESNPLEIQTNTLLGSWFEWISGASGRCRLCQVKMTKHSFPKHLKTKMHLQNLHSHRISQNSRETANEEPSMDKNEGMENHNLKKWKLLENLHPWIAADPKDSAFAYCKYCEKRFMYGHSAVKRAVHENSSGHKMALYLINQSSQATDVANQTANQSQNNDDNEDDEVASNTETNTANESNDEQQEESESDEEENSKDDDEQKKPRMKRGSDEWFALLPWCKKIPKNPNMLYCTYCKIEIAITNSRRKHAESLRHSAREKELSKRGLGRRLKNSSTIYPWLTRLKAYPNNIYCKYCRIRFSNAFSRKKHETTMRHKDAANAYIARHKKRMQQETEKHANPNAEEVIPPKSPEPVPVKNIVKPTPPPISHYAKVMLWRQKYNWLSYKRNEKRPSYIFCKICEHSLYIPTLSYAKRHQLTSRHISMRTKLKHMENARLAPKVANKDDSTLQDASAEQVQENTVSNQRTERIERRNEQQKKNESAFWVDIQKQFSWLQSGKRRGTMVFGFCQICRLPISATPQTLQRHEQAPKHVATLKRMSINNDATEQNTVISADNSTESPQLNEEDNVEDLAPDKSEQPSAKRLKTALETAKRLTNAHNEILNLTRVLNGTIGIDETPTTPTATTGPAERNSFDLFFESVSETFKKFPSDLSAEGKMKIMQLVYDLEMRAFRRKEGKNSDDNDGIMMPTSSSVVEENNSVSPQEVAVTAATPIQSNGNVDDEHLTSTARVNRNAPVLIKQTTPSRTESTLSKDGSVRRIVLNSMSSKYVIRDGKITYMVSPKSFKTTNEQQVLNGEESARRFIHTSINGSNTTTTNSFNANSNNNYNHNLNH